jgi:putative oxidoreductase
MSIAFGLLVLRLVVGLTIAAHGSQKLFGVWGGSGMNGWAQVVQRLRMRPARPLAWIAAVSEFGGGLLLALGLLSPLGSLAIVGAMLVAIATVHLSKGFWVTKGGFEFNLTLIGAAAALAIAGPGAYSLDNVLRIHLPEPVTLLVGTILVIAGVTVTLASRTPQVEAKPQTT